jgi:hypothetical protein
MRKWPLAFTPAANTLAYVLIQSVRGRWQSFEKDDPSGVGVMRRLVRTSNFTPNRSSSASSLLPMMASQILDLRRSPHVTLVDYGTKSHNLLELIHGVWGLWESAPAFLWCLIFNKIKNGAFL